MSIQTMQSKLTVASIAAEEAKMCARCQDHKERVKSKSEEGEETKTYTCRHCHCKFLIPDPELLLKMRNFEPVHNYKEALEKERLYNKKKNQEDQEKIRAN